MRYLSILGRSFFKPEVWIISKCFRWEWLFLLGIAMKRTSWLIMRCKLWAASGRYILCWSFKFVSLYVYFDWEVDLRKRHYQAEVINRNFRINYTNAEKRRWKASSGYVVVITKTFNKHMFRFSPICTSQEWYRSKIRICLHFLVDKFYYISIYRYRVGVEL